ncbi:hypothetical protein DYB32_007290 [Aphanomyces invadans]|uniref:Major facilitator superfamily (MFS) profile domain-containing protein n=1 Tax=Aphanomyces invadans TaxID=157072 RepID=A0A3R6V7B3_9STRA|nr:hypothetical protein DYB32_007290 [Aphanomyces invadans]
MADQWLLVLPMGNDFFSRLDCIPFHRTWLCLACCVVQFCAGSMYAFTMLTDSVDGNVTKEAANRVLLLAYVCLGVSAALAGPFAERQGPRQSIALGTAIVAIGQVLSQLAITFKLPFVLLLGYKPLAGFLGLPNLNNPTFGVCVGLGFGVLLITSISTVQKWYPDKRGVGAMHRLGLAMARLLSTFIVASLLMSTLVLRTPPVSYTVKGKDIHNVDKHRAPNPTLVQDEFLNVGMTQVNYTVVQHELDVLLSAGVKAMSLVQCIASTDFI